MSLVGFKAQNHPQQSVKDDVDQRCVLPEFFGPLHALRDFTIDAAAADAAHVLPRYWTRETDGLAQSWRNERVWCNPPYSGIGRWIDKAWYEMRENDCGTVTMLLPANRCEQRWWQEGVEPFRDRDIGGVRLQTKFLPGRLRFAHPADWTKPAKGDRPPFGCVLLDWF